MAELVSFEEQLGDMQLQTCNHVDHEETDAGSKEVEPYSSSSCPLSTPAVKFDALATRYYLSPYLLYIECDRRILSDKEIPKGHRLTFHQNQRRKCSVNGMIESVILKIKAKGPDMFRRGELSLCGSVAEGTKVSSCDEFDYQYIIDLEDYKATRKPLLRTKARSANEMTKTFYKLTVGSSGCEQELRAKDVHDNFKGAVDKAISSLGLQCGCFTKKAGPAVKIVLWDETPSGKKICRMKVDLTLGIRTDPRELFTEDELTPLAKSPPWNVDLNCHFVCAHDYWKACFVKTEQELMERICRQDMYKMAVYRAIKCLRDKVDIKDPYGDGILPSHPIKVTFLDIALKDCLAGVKWRMEDIGKHTINILREVEERGQGHRLNDLFLTGDDVMAESDRSYLESRRILSELKRVEGLYLDQALLLPMLFLLSWIRLVEIFAACLLDVFSLSNFEEDLELWTCEYRLRAGLLVKTIWYVTNLMCIYSVNSYRILHPLPTIYPYISFLRRYFLIMCTGVLIAYITQNMKLVVCASRPEEVFSIWICGALSTFISITPCLVSGVSVTVNAYFSIIYKKNLLLFDPFLTFPSFNWRWRAPDGNYHEFVPEITGNEGLKTSGTIRAYLIFVLTPITIFVTAFAMFDTYLRFSADMPSMDACFMCATSAFLVLLLSTLSIYQVLESQSTRVFWRSVFLRRFRSFWTSSVCYFLPYHVCSRCKVIRDDLKKV